MESIANIMKEMIAYSNGNTHDINHFIKVWTYAKTIAELENVDANTQYILEIAAILHDIACPVCRKKYGHTSGPVQEKEGAILAKEFLSNYDIPDGIIARICYLIGHHHTYNAIDGIDYQILIEADFIANCDESNYSINSISKMLNNIFKTQSGIAILKSIYLKHAV